jgi:hypothetical protein
MGSKIVKMGILPSKSSHHIKLFINNTSCAINTIAQHYKSCKTNLQWSLAPTEKQPNIISGQIGQL